MREGRTYRRLLSRTELENHDAVRSQERPCLLRQASHNPDAVLSREQRRRRLEFADFRLQRLRIDRRHVGWVGHDEVKRTLDAGEEVGICAVDTRRQSVTGDIAVTAALNVLKNQKAQTSVRDQVIALYKGSAPKITYNPAYKPPPETTTGTAAVPQPGDAALATPPAKK